MINSFLVTLVNDGTPPVNPMSQVGDVLWPGIYLPKSYGSVEESVIETLYSSDGDYLHDFLTAIQMLFVVESSVMAATITQDDPKISYNRVQLLGQFEGVDPLTYSYQQTDRMIAALPSIPGELFLTGDALQVFRSALSPIDRLAAVISHFGLRP